MSNRVDDRERGMTMIELIIAMSIGVMVAFLAVGLLVSTIRTQRTVTAVTAATTQGQGVSTLIDKSVRTAAALTVSTDANAAQLYVRPTAAACQAEGYSAGTCCESFALVSDGHGSWTLRHRLASTATGTGDSTWPLLASAITHPTGSSGFFTSLNGGNTGVSYALQLQGVGGATIASTAVESVPGGSGSPCFT